MRLYSLIGILLLVACSKSQASLLPPAAPEAVRLYAGECDQGIAESCYALAWAWAQDDADLGGIGQNLERAGELFERSCQGGVTAACELVEFLANQGHLPEMTEVPSPVLSPMGREDMR